MLRSNNPELNKLLEILYTIPGAEQDIDQEMIQELEIAYISDPIIFQHFEKMVKDMKKMSVILDLAKQIRAVLQNDRYIKQPLETAELKQIPGCENLEILQITATGKYIIYDRFSHDIGLRQKGASYPSAQRALEYARQGDRPKVGL